MNPKTGEIKKFEIEDFKEKRTPDRDPSIFTDKLKDIQEQPKKTIHKIPEDWIGLPMPGEEVEVITLPDKKRGRMWKVVDIVEGKPGQMILKPCVETVNKCKKG